MVCFGKFGLALVLVGVQMGPVLQRAGGGVLLGLGGIKFKRNAYLGLPFPFMPSSFLSPHGLLCICLHPKPA